ncbi:MAG: Cache 3/Cache 2 fusion domain-containing protein, partial [Burkholderiaceae bacterium]
MTTTTHPTRSLARRVALLSVALLAAVLVITSGVMAMVAEGRSRDRIVLWVGDKAQSVADSIDAFDLTARLMTDRAYKPFRRKYADVFEVSADGTMLTSWGMLLNGDFTEVDLFHEQNGGVASIFQRKGDDFERITTSLKQADGERANGSMLERTHPAYPLMLEGKNYTGRTMMFGRPYMTHYESIKNAAGEVVAILSIGFDMTDFQTSLEQVVSEARFFDTGATYVIDPRQSNAEAVFVVHPTAAGKKVLEVQPQAEAMLTRLREETNAFYKDATPLLGVEMADPWVVKRQAKSGGWWVLAEVSDDEAMVSHWQTIYVFWGLLGVAAIVIGLALFALVRRLVTRPLHDLTTAVTAVAEGDLSRGFTSGRTDEIGRLISEVEGMRQRFSGIVGQLRGATDSINTASMEIAAGNQDLSARTEQAASNLEETAASMEELTSTVRNSADAARQANQLAASAAEVAVRGGEVVGQ